LIPPQSYPRVALPEDRQFIPAEFVPLWIGKGWQRALIRPVNIERRP
jgi:hypothetical protein